MTDILLHLKETLLRETAQMGPEEFIIRGIWNFIMRSQPNPAERFFSESGCLVATSGLGASFRPSSHSVPIPDSLIGQDGRKAVAHDRAMQVAILDACYAVLQQTPFETFIIDGDTVNKSIQRARITCNEVKLIANQLSISKPTVLMIGVVHIIVEQFQKSGLNVVLSDLDQRLIKNGIEAVEIHDGRLNPLLIPDCDIILATGMTITTETLGTIIDSAKQHNKPLVLYAQTGSNFAEEYIKLGVTGVLAEHYPWYVIPGQSIIKVFRKVE